MSQKNKNINVAVVGLGNMGQKHVKTVKECRYTNLIATVDPQQEADYISVKNMLEIQKPDCAIISSPTTKHLDSVLPFLEENIHVLVEKPVVSSHKEIVEIKNKAKNSKSHIAVGHIERFNPSIQSLKNDLEGQTIIDFYSKRVSPMPKKINDVGVSLDLAVHDIDLVTFLTEKRFTKCISNKNYLNNEVVEDNVTIFLNGENRIKQRGSYVINASWSYPFRERKAKILTDKFFYDVDMINMTVSKMEGSKYGSGYFVSNLFINKVDPLQNQLLSFLKYIETGEKGHIADLDDGIAALNLAMEASK